MSETKYICFAPTEFARDRTLLHLFLLLDDVLLVLKTARLLKTVRR